MTMTTETGATMTKPKKPKVRTIRQGDCIRVVNPEFVVRVGYPMAVKDESWKIVAEAKEEIRMLLMKLGMGYDGWSGNAVAIQKVANIAAYERCKAMKWGGKERTIHTKRFEEHAGMEFVVRSVRFVKTGEYSPACNWGDDYDPPFLSNEKTHRILELPLSLMMDDSYLDPYMVAEIEACNVVLLED